MTSPLEGSLAKTVYKAFKNIFLNATLARDTVITTSPDVPYDPTTPTTVTYTCKAIVQDYSNYYRLQDIVQAGDRRVLILAQSLDVTPVPGDRITISGATFNVVNVKTDPATATWECQGRTT